MLSLLRRAKSVPSEEGVQWVLGGQNVPERKKRTEPLWQNHIGYTPAKRPGMSNCDDIRVDTEGKIRGDWGGIVRSEHRTFGKLKQRRSVAFAGKDPVHGIWKYQQRIVARSWDSIQETMMVWTIQSSGTIKKLEDFRNTCKVKLTGFALVPMEVVKESPC